MALHINDDDFGVDNIQSIFDFIPLKSKLSILPIVCKKWYYIINSSSWIKKVKKIANTINDFFVKYHFSNFNIVFCINIIETHLYIKICKEIFPEKFLKIKEIAGFADDDDYSIPVNNKELKKLELIPNLEELTLTDSPITDLTPIHFCQKLTKIWLNGCKLLLNLKPLVTCPNLKEIFLGHNIYLIDINPISKCKELEILDLLKCKNLKNISCLENCKKLKYLCIGGCINIESIECLKNCDSLEEIEVTNCSDLIHSQVSEIFQ